MISALGLLFSLGLPHAAPLTLTEARAVASEQAVAVERARALADAASADAWAATAGALPSVTGFASASTGAGFTAFGFERPVTTQLGLGAQGSWALLSPADWAAARAARRGAVGQEAMVRWAMVEARRDATAAFAATLAAQRQEDALVSATENARDNLSAVSELVAAGLRRPVDESLARSEMTAREADRLAASWTAQARCAELMALLRGEVGAPCELLGPAWSEPVDGPAAHPALQAAEAALSEAAALRGQSVVSLLPSVSANGVAAWYAADDGGGPGWSAGLEMSAPLTTSGAGRAGVQIAAARERVAALALEEQERSLRVALVSAEARHDAALSALDARRAALEAAREAASLSDEGYREGFVSQTALLAARQARDAAAVALTRAEAELGIALGELEAARGVW